MFIRTIKDKITEYNGANTNIIQKISFDQNFFLNILSFHGKIPTEKLQKYDQGIFGSIHISAMFVFVNTVSVSSDVMSDLFDTLQEDEPCMKDIKAELLSLVNEVNLKKIPAKIEPTLMSLKTLPLKNMIEIKKPEFSSLGMFGSENLKTNQRNQFYCVGYNEEDIKEMAKDFGSFSYETDQISTLNTAQFRTTKAHYKDSDIHCCDQVNVCRTTVTMPHSNCTYIECRFMPYQNYGGKQEKMATRTWSICFFSEEKADNFLNLLYSNEHISTRQKQFDNDYQKNGKKVISKYKNLLHVDNVEICP